MLKRTCLILLALFVSLLMWSCRNDFVHPSEEPADDDPYVTRISDTPGMATVWSYGDQEISESFTDLHVHSNGSMTLAMEHGDGGFMVVRTDDQGAQEWRRQHLKGQFSAWGNYYSFVPYPHCIVVGDNGHIYIGGERSAHSVGRSSIQRQGFLLELDGEGNRIEEMEKPFLDCEFDNTSISSIALMPDGSRVYGGSSKSSCVDSVLSNRILFVNEQVVETRGTAYPDLEELKVDQAGNVVVTGRGGPEDDEFIVRKADAAGNELFYLNWSDLHNDTYDFQDGGFLELLSNGNILAGCKVSDGSLLVLLNGNGGYMSHRLIPGVNLRSAVECDNGEIVYSGSEGIAPLLFKTSSTLTTVWKKYYYPGWRGVLNRVRKTPNGGLAACGWFEEEDNETNGLLLLTDENGN